MLDIKFIRENLEIVKNAVLDKQFNPDIINRVLELDGQRRTLIQKIEDIRKQANEFQSTIKGKPTDEQIARGKQLKQEEAALKPEFVEVEKKYYEALLEIPNLPKKDVKIGKNETENEILEDKKYKEPTKFSFTPKDHLELGEKLDIIDVKNAAKVSGSRFAYLKNDAVLLEFALIQFGLKTLIKEGFTPVVPPVIIKHETTKGLGYWQAGGHGDYYLIFNPNCRKCDLDLGCQAIVKAGLEEKLRKTLLDLGLTQEKINEAIEKNHVLSPLPIKKCIRCGEDLGSNYLYLVGTAEHSLVPMHMDKTFESKDLPKRYVGFSSAFRREAGSYTKDIKGILRVHQFDKLEMVSFVKEGEDDKEHEYLLSLEEKLFKALGVPFQVVKMCTGDLGFPAARKYDIEAWMPGQNKYREVTSVSTVTDFQSRRLNIRYQDGNEKKYVNILNGTGFAIGRTIIAILENYQQADGSVLIPEVLQDFVGKEKIG